MIPAHLPRAGLAVLLCSLASLALAQQPPAQQRSRTEPKPAAQPQSAPQRGTAPAAQQKPATPPKGAAPSTPAKPAASTPAKPGGPGPAKPGAAGAAKPGSAGPAGGTLLASFNDWGAYASGEGRTRVCYALSRPKERLPKDLKRDQAYLFVSFRPADNVRNEVAVVMGFAMKDETPAEAVVGPVTYALMAKGTNAWIRNPSEESQAIANFSKGQSVVVKATSGRGNPTSDRYSLAGFAQALDRARKECS